MKSILVPTDFSDCANDALRVAADLARKCDADIVLAHVYEKPLQGISVGVSIDKDALRHLRSEIFQKMEKLCSQDFLKGITVEQHFIPDKQLWQILKSSGLKDVDLIVMGSHGASGFKELMIGSNAQKIVQMAEVPVLVIKSYFNADRVRNVVFASDFYRESEPGFEPILQIAELLNAHVHLLKIITPTNFEPFANSEKLMSDFAETHNIQDFTINVYNESGVERGIKEFSATVGADIIAIETHGRKGLKHALLGSLAEQVVNHSELPILSTHVKDELARA